MTVRGFSAASALAWLAWLSMMGACKQDGRTTPPGPLVRSVEIEGNQNLEDDEIIEHLNLQPTSPLALTDRSYYLPGLEQTDRERIEQYYRAHGYYEAEATVTSVEIARESKKMKRRRADVAFSVEEGHATTVRRLEFDWVGGGVDESSRPAFERACPLEPGGRFGGAELGEARDAVRGALEDAGYAFAEVREEAIVDLSERLADVRLVVEPGPRKKITAIEVEGLVRVPKTPVVHEADIVVGKYYSRTRVREVQSSVYGMGVFSTVTVVRGARTPDQDLTLIVRVSESPMQRIRLGVGAHVDPVRWQQHATAQYDHQNLWGRLYHFTARLRGGYAQLPAIYAPQQHGPIASADLELRKKGLLEKRLVWTESPGFELGIWEGYQFYAVTNRLGVSRFFTRYFELGLSYNNRFTDLFNIQPNLDRNRTLLGLDFRDPYFLAYLQLVPTLHLTDDILRPENGVRFSVPYDFANPYLGGQFSYHKIVPDLRAYYRPHDRVQLAARARIGILIPYGDAAGVPLDHKFYLGGSNDVRGWPLRRISPRVGLCPDDPTSCQGTPVGGSSMLNGNFELRVRAVDELWIAAFVDTGDVRDGVLSFRFDQLLYTTGGGLRYHSPVGTLRLDVGGQLNQDPRFPEPRRWAIHFGIGEAF